MRVFVYGTLKTGQPNYPLIEKALKKGVVTFVGKGQTVDKLPLIIAGRYNIPYLCYAEGKGNRVFGEVYDVDEKTLEQLDHLEEIPFHYQIEYLDVELVDGKDTNRMTRCLTYVCKTFKPEMLERPYYTEYDAYGSHGLVYSSDHQITDPEYRYDVIKRPQSS